MSLEAILEAIRYEGKIQVRQIEAQAEEETSSILAKAQAEAAHLREAIRHETAEKVAGERTRILNQARFKGLCLVGAAREELVEEVLVEVARRLAAARAHPDYLQVLIRLLVEALECFLEKGALIEADERDRHLLEEVILELKLDYSVEYRISCWGGVILRSRDGRVAAVNTLESRLERARPLLQQRLRVLIEELTFNSEGSAQHAAGVRILSIEE